MLTFHSRGKLKELSEFENACHQLEGGFGLGQAGGTSELESIPSCTSSSPTISKLLAPPPTDPMCYELIYLAENRLLCTKG